MQRFAVSYNRDLDGHMCATIAVPASTLCNPKELYDLHTLCIELKQDNIEFCLDIVGKNTKSKASDNACHRGLSKCRGCCPLARNSCHCDCTNVKTHTPICYGGYSNCNGCDPCGSPNCHFPTCTVYHDQDGKIVLPDGDTYDPYK